MPTYTYSCLECDADFDKSRGILEEEPTYICELCGFVLVRSYTSSVSIQFNGSGFYSTDK